MKFIVDAQLPRSLADLFREKGHDTLHTIELRDGNETLDSDINQLSLAEQRIVVTKDGDFYNSFTATREPYKLLHVKTGNISNSELISLFNKNFETIERKLIEGSVVEISRHLVIVIQ